MEDTNDIDTPAYSSNSRSPADTDTHHSAQVNRRRIFVIHGRNEEARAAMFAFLRALDLAPIEWSTAISMTGQGSPFIGDVLTTALDRAQAIVVLLTPDELASLRPEYAAAIDDPELLPTPQARPNVLFEAGMAFGRAPERTILVQIGKLREFSDISGRHVLRLNSTVAKRQELALRLKDAGCHVDMSGSEWHTAGVFTSPIPPADTAQHQPDPTQAKHFPTPTKPTLRVHNYNATDSTNGTEVVGEVTNTSESNEHSGILKATFYSSGNIVGTATGVINQIRPTETKTFNLRSATRVAFFDTLKVQVDTLL